MALKSVGFIGGGRITRIMLKGFETAGVKFETVVVSDLSLENLQKLKDSFPDTCIAYNDNLQAARQDIVFISVHPPVIDSLLQEIKSAIKPDSVVISLAPKIKIDKLINQLDGFQRVARMNPSAPSIVNAGFNPICFSEAITENERSGLVRLLSNLGDVPIVSEGKIEAYAVFTAMGPTYFWFQFYELQNIISGFGLDKKEFQEGITKMLNGSLKTMFSELLPEEVMDLVPVRPIGEAEAIIKDLYKEKLNQVFDRIRT